MFKFFKFISRAYFTVNFKHESIMFVDNKYTVNFKHESIMFLDGW